jgi:hydantoinase/carbamoylase family amidase
MELQSLSQSPESSESINMATELQRINYLGETQCLHSENPLSAHLEPHIEQGPLLEETQKKVGAMEGVQGMRWFSINCRGKEAHAGATRMVDRADALVVLAKFAVKVEELAKRHDAFETVGVMRTKTNSINTVPGGAFCTLDLRHWSDATLDLIESELRALLKQQQDSVPGIKVSMDRTWCKKSVRFDPVARQCVRDAARATVDKSLLLDMISYAGHDSAETAHVVPTAMIFVPSKSGISHNPAEFTNEQDS